MKYVAIRGDAIVSLRNLAKGFSKSMENAMKMVGFRLKVEMEEDIKNDRMGWDKPSPLTLKLRKRFKKDNVSGIYFAKGAGSGKSFIRYRIDKDDSGYSLKVGVIDPGKGKGLSKSLKVNSEKFAQGWQYTVTEKVNRARIKTYVERTRKKSWKQLSKKQKENVRKELIKYGVVKKVGKIVKAPPRPMDTFTGKREKWILESIEKLYARKLKGEEIPNDWWKMK